MAASQGTLQILIDIQAQLADLQSAISGATNLDSSAAAAAGSLQGIAAQLDAIGGNLGGLDEAKSKLGEITEQGNEFFASLKAGFALDLAGRFTEGIAGAGEKLKAAAEQGVEYNAKMQTGALGLAATLRSVQPAHYLNFEEAKNSATLALDVIRDRANAAGLDVHAVMEAESADMKALVEGGITDTGKQLDVVTTLIGAAATKGITGVQALRDSIDILNGRAGNIVLAKELGLESEALKKAAASGQEYEYIMGRIGGYKEAIAEQASSFAGVSQTFHNLIEQMEGDAARPIFETLQHGIAGINKDLQGSGGLASELRDVGHAAGDVTAAGVGVTRWAIQNAGAIEGLGRVILSLVAGYALLKAVQLSFGVATAIPGMVQAKAAEYDAQRAIAATRALVEVQREEVASSLAAAAAEERLAMARREASINAQLASVHEAHELPGQAPQLLGPPISLAEPLEKAAEEAAPVMARISTSFETLFAGIGTGAATVGKAIYAALGPVGIAFIAAEAIYTLVDRAGAATEKRDHDLLDMIRQASAAVADFKRQVNTVDSGSGRDALVKALDDKVQELTAARDDVAKAVAVLDASRVSSGRSGRVVQEATEEQQALQRVLDLRNGELGVVERLAGKAQSLTAEEISRRSVEAAITEEVESQSKALSEMVAKLPSIIAGLHDAAHQAELANNLANAADATGRMSILRSEHSKLLQNASNLNYQAGGDPDAMVGSSKDMTDVLQGMSDRVRAKGAAVSPEELQAVEQYKDKITDVQHIEDQINSTARERTAETQRQTDAAGKMHADLDRENAVNKEIIAGHKDRANQIQFEAEVEKKAVDVSKAYNVSMDDARKIARENLSLDVQAHDVESAAKGAKKEGAAAARESLNATKEEAMYARQVAEEKLKAIQAQGQRIESDPFLFSDQKNKQLLDNYVQQRQQIQAIMQMDAQRIALERGSTNPGMAAQLRADTKGLADAGLQLAKVNQQMRTMSFAGTIRTQLTSWVNQFGTAAHQVGQVMTSVLGHGIDGVSSAITGLITHTTTLKQAMGQMAQSIVADLVKMGVEYVVQQGVMFAARLLFGNADAAASNGQAQAALQAWTPAAVAASIASYGVAAAVGQASAMAAIGSSEAGGLFSEGGYTGAGGRHEAAGIVHRDEYVIDSPTLRRAGGPAVFDRMRARVRAGDVSSATAGVGPTAGGGSAAGTPRSPGGQTHFHVALVNRDSEARSYLDSVQGQKHVSRITRRNRRRIGVRY